MDNLTSINLTDLTYNPSAQQQIYTFKDVLSQFSDQFIFKTGLMAVSFFLVMCYLQYYSVSLSKEHKLKEKESGRKLGMKRRDVILIYISDIFFLASFAYFLIYLGYYTGWFI